MPVQSFEPHPGVQRAAALGLLFGSFCRSKKNVKTSLLVTFSYKRKSNVKIVPYLLFAKRKAPKTVP